MSHRERGGWLSGLPFLAGLKFLREKALASHFFPSPPPPQSKHSLHVTCSEQADTEREPGVEPLGSQPTEPDTFNYMSAIEQKEYGVLNHVRFRILTYISDS